MERHGWSLEDLNKVAAMAEELKRLEVLHLFIIGGTLVHMMPDGLASVAALLGQQPDKQVHMSGEYWRCTLHVGDLELFALFHPHELPLIGYPEEPLPPKEEVAVEVEAALQAS